MAAAKKSSSKKRASPKKPAAKRSSSTRSAAKKPAAKKSAPRSATRASAKPAPKRAAPKAAPKRSAPVQQPAPEPVRRAQERAKPRAAMQPTFNEREPWKPVFTFRPAFVVALRVLLGFTFLWAFLDKLFGLGYSTTHANSWINSGSPTEGFLLHAAQGPFAGFFHAIAPSPIVAWLFMLGLLGVGVAFLFGIKTRLASYAGAAMLFLMYLAEAVWLPGSTNPLIDDHIIYAVAMIAIGHARYSLKCDVVRNWWVKLPMVRRREWLA